MTWPYCLNIKLCFWEIQQQYCRENTRTGQFSSMNKYKKVLSFNDNTTKEQSRVSSNIKKVFPDMIALQKQLKVSANINKFFLGLIASQEHLKVSPNIKKMFFPGLIRPRKSWHSRLFRMLTLWWEERPRPMNQSITVVSDITQLWKEYISKAITGLICWLPVYLMGTTGHHCKIVQDSAR